MARHLVILSRQLATGVVLKLGRPSEVRPTNSFNVSGGYLARCVVQLLFNLHPSPQTEYCGRTHTIWQIALGVALVTTLLNQFLLEPASTDIMFKRYALEDVSIQLAHQLL